MSKADPVHEPSMDEILASIRQIIEAGDDRWGTISAKSAPAAGSASFPARKTGAVASNGNAAVAAASRLSTDPALSKNAPRPAERPTGESEILAKSAAASDAAPRKDGANVAQARMDEETVGTVSDMKPPAAAKIPEETPSSFKSAASADDDLARSNVEPFPSILSDSSKQTGTRQEPASPQPAGNAGRANYKNDFDEDALAKHLLDELHGVDKRLGTNSRKETPSTRADNEAGIAASVPEDRSGPAANTAFPDEDRSRRLHLLSDDAGRQVTAAFDDLNIAIREGRIRSMEEMAEDMLRPMLREWLDDNLPTLVEKLVREEIERVARGGLR